MSIGKLICTFSGLSSLATWLQAAPPPTTSAKPEGATPATIAKWDTRLTFGLTLTRGNKDTFLANAGLATTRKHHQNELRLGLDGAYGEAEGNKNIESIKGQGQYNYTLPSAPRWFAYGRAEGLHDGIAAVDYRLNVSPGFGWHALKSLRLTGALEGGPAVIAERVNQEEAQYGSGRLAQRWEFKLNTRARFWHTAEYLPELSDASNYLVNAELGIETAINSSWNLRVLVRDSFDGQPAANRQSNDLKLISGVSMKF
jgi:putative salt-induced outer membrane protein YdiY